MKKAKHWILTKRPIGNDYEPAFELVEEDLPPLEDGQYLLKTRVLSMDSGCLLYTSPSPRDQRGSRMPSSA